MIIFGSPTYGTGDWHYLFDKWKDRIERDSRVNWSEKMIALFSLGNYRHHPNSFAGALIKLKTFADSLDASLVGRVEKRDDYNSEMSEMFKGLLSENYIPGLVLDQVNERRLSKMRIASWAEEIRKRL